MIADDMMSFIKSDIIVFGIGVFIFIILTLWFIFKNIKWVVLPLIGCATSVIIMIGLLGLIGWKVTVISSNFIALNVNFKYGNEYSCNGEIFAIKKRISELLKNEACIRSE